MFSDLALSRRLERAEGYACAQFADARRRLFPHSRAEWIECAGAYAVFDDVDSPVTQSFGLGIFENASAASLDVIERFFFDRGSPALHEVSPHAGVIAFDLLCTRGYRPIEISNVLYRHVEKPTAEDDRNINVRVIGPEESQLFASISARGWRTNIPNFWTSFFKSERSLRRARGVCASSARLMVYQVPPACSVCTTESRCSAVRRHHRNCAVAGCRPRSFESACATPTTMAASWR